MAEEKNDPDFRFANAPVNDDGELQDFRDVPAYEDDSEEAKVRDESQKTQSSVVDFKTEGTSTNGFPAAEVPAKGVDKTGTEPKDKAQTAKAAGGKGANQS